MFRLFAALIAAWVVAFPGGPRLPAAAPASSHLMLLLAGLSLLAWVARRQADEHDE